MLKFVRLADQAVVTEQDIDPLCTAPSPLFRPDAELYAPIAAAARPPFDPLTQVVEEVAPVLVQGIWTQAWAVRTATPAEAAAAAAALIDRFSAAMTAFMDAKARERRYDNRLSCALRAGFVGPFQAEGLAFAQWMDASMAYGYQVISQVQAGQRQMPASVAAFLAELPELVWPA